MVFTVLLAGKPYLKFLRSDLIDFAETISAFCDEFKLDPTLASDSVLVSL